MLTRRASSFVALPAILALLLCGCGREHTQRSAKQPTSETAVPIESGGVAPNGTIDVPEDEMEDESHPDPSSFTTTTIDTRNYAGEAAAAVEKLFATALTRCADGWVYWRNGWIVWMTHSDQRSYDASGEYKAPKLLTEVDRANGVDPQPVEWEGTGRARFGLSRGLRCAQGSRCYEPGDWQSEYIQAYDVRLRKGQWEVTERVGSNNLRPGVAPFDCSELPGIREQIDRLFPEKLFYPRS
jgi:hypothetical protein